MFQSRQEREAEVSRKAAVKWISKYRDRKLKRMEKARRDYEKGEYGGGGLPGSSESRSSRLKSTLSSNSGGSNLSGESTANLTDSRKLNILQAKLKHKLIKQKQKEKAERRKLCKQQQRLQAELEYINFPTIMGWYFDGFFTQPFALNEKYAEMFNELEEGIAHKKELSFKETFTERTRRNFWPPPIIAGNCFRTRGVYMDHYETKKDPPHTPPQIDFEHIKPEGNSMLMDPSSTTNYYGSKVKFTDDKDMARQPYMKGGRMGSTHSLDSELPNEVEQDEEDDDDSALPRVVRFGRKRKQKFKVRTNMFYKLREQAKKNTTKKTDFYFDDENVGFYKKKRADEGMYYYDLKYEVWRIKRTPKTFATDFYFDQVAGAYLAKDRSRKADDYIFDPTFFCYKLNGQNGSPKNGMTPDDYSFDERSGKWRKTSSLSAEEKKLVAVDYNASRFAIKDGNNTPDDFYFDIDTGKYELKVDADHEKYTYNTAMGAWVLTEPKEMTNDVQKSKYKVTPNFYFWDETKYRFRRKNGPSAYFIYDTNNKFYRMKKSIKGKYNPKNWRWDDTKKEWYLLKRASIGGYYNDDLHWRPERDYDKPWLEYVGGYYYRPRKDSFQDDEEDSKSGNPDMNTKDEKPKSSILVGRKIPVKAAVDDGAMAKPAAKTKLELALEAHELYDARVLKVYGLGSVVNEADLKAYFPSAIKILRPKVIDSDVSEDFAVLYFLTDEAASAALKTMNKKKIKGLTLHCGYCRKDDKKIYEYRVAMHTSSLRKKSL